MSRLHRRGPRRQGRIRRREATDIDQNVYPLLDSLGIPTSHVRRDIGTDRLGRMRGDLWISLVPDSDPAFEDRIITLIECKDRHCSLGDSDWQDAQAQGQQKANRQRLRSFFVTNTLTHTRCYNSADMSEVILDGQSISQLQPVPILRAIQTQVQAGRSSVAYRSLAPTTTDPNQFRRSLWELRQIFRACGVSRGSEASMIKTTLTFCILKLISERQRVQRTLPNTILLWDDWRPNRMATEMRSTINDLVSLQDYWHLKGCLEVDYRLNDSACQNSHSELSGYTLFNSDFDFFGLIYESFAKQHLKKDFGEFYTPRHVIRTIVRLLLNSEQEPRPMSICDAACGTGGFLVEAFLFLKRNYHDNGLLSDQALCALKESIFWGFDNNQEVAIPFARTNMMMAGDSGTNIQYVEDSLVTLGEDGYDYALANIPYGQYSGHANLDLFSYARRRRFELLFLEKITKSLHNGGHAAIIVPDALVGSTDYGTYRKNFLFDADLHAVVSLPHFVFQPYTSEKTYVLFFSRKKRNDQGRLQNTPIWHYIVDHDGYQEGVKRYPTPNENDLPELEQVFCNTEIEGKSRFVPIDQVNEDNFYSLCSEDFLRRRPIIELSENRFNSILREVEREI